MLKKPKHLAPTTFYMREYFEDRIRPIYEREWARKEKQLLARLPKGSKIANLGGVQMDLRRKVATRMLAEETDEFREQLKADIDDD